MKGHKLTLDLALSYTPPGSDLSLTLAIVRDAALLIATIRQAIREADGKAASESNPLLAKGFQTQRNFLAKCLDELTGELPAAAGKLM